MSSASMLFDAGKDQALQEKITVGFLIDVLKNLPEDAQVSISIGPDYEDTPLTSAIMVPNNGCLFLIGEISDEEEEEDPTAEPDVIDVPFEVVEDEEVPDGVERI